MSAIYSWIVGDWNQFSFWLRTVSCSSRHEFSTESNIRTLCSKRVFIGCEVRSTDRSDLWVFEPANKFLDPIKRWPEIAEWSHTAIGFFPWIVVAAAISVIFGAATGGAAADTWFTLSGDWDISRIAFHIPAGLGALYIGISWLGAAIGTSPHRSIGTVFLAPLFVFLAHWAYGAGLRKSHP